MDQHRHEPSPLSISTTVVDESKGPPLPPRRTLNGTVKIIEEGKVMGSSTGVETPMGVVSRGTKTGGVASESMSESSDNAEVVKGSQLQTHHATLQETAQSLTDQALQFLSTASNETIGACLVGLSATTYLVLGRVGLILMGVVGGVVLHATWEGSHNATLTEARADEEKRRREIGLDVVKRAMTWRTQRRDEQQAAIQAAEGEKIDFISESKLNFENLPLECGAALNELVDAGVRDYVKWWYNPLIPGENLFPTLARQTSTAFILSISNHLSRKRPADAFLEFLTHSSSILIVFLNELAIAVNARPDVSTQEAIQIYLQNKPDSNLAYVLDTDHQQKKLDLVAEDVLQTYLESKSYNCEPVRVFLREVFSKVVLDMTVQMCSRAEFINEWIVYLLDENYVPLTGPEIKEEVEKEKAPSSAGLGIEKSPEQLRHRRVVSKAQEAMDEAMREAARLTQMIAEDDARRQKEKQVIETQEDAAAKDVVAQTEAPVSMPVKTLASSVTLTDDTVESSTQQGIHTPTSSQSDQVQASPPLSQSETESAPTGFESNRASAEESKAPTSFDDILRSEKPTALMDEEERKRREPPPLTLHNATIVLLDDSDPSDRASIKTKPISDFLVQVEPSTSYYPGWMIVRRLTDFESLHQILFRIARVSDAKKFAEAHLNLPHWKGTTKAKYREELERYLNDAMQHRSLADCEGMKRFLEKDQYMSKNMQNKAFPGLNAIENVGKGVADAVGQGAKGVVGGGKAMVGGVTGVIGAAGRVITTGGGKKGGVGGVPAMNQSTSSLSSIVATKTGDQVGAGSSNPGGASPAARASQDSIKNMSPIVDTQPAPMPQMERRPSSKIPEEELVKPATDPYYTTTPILGGDQFITLPPPPDAMPDDYDPSKIRPSSSRASEDIFGRASLSTPSSVFDGKMIPDSPLAAKKHRSKANAPPPLSEQEAQVAVELGLAAITELYKLSSAWSVRLAFLSAAKSILLRPGNAQLDSLRQLMQTTILDTHFSDSGIAQLIKTTRANTLPTEEERAAWPRERNAEEREVLRRQARKILLEKGMPTALNSVMGQAASAEALGRVFDALQVQKVARGLVFGLVLQGLRAVVQ